MKKTVYTLAVLFFMISCHRESKIESQEERQPGGGEIADGKVLAGF